MTETQPRDPMEPHTSASEPVAEIPTSAERSRRSRLSLLSNFTVRTRLLALAGILGVLWALVVALSLTGIANVRTHYNATAAGLAQLSNFHQSDEAWYLADDTAGIEASLLLIHTPASNPILKLVSPIPVAEEKLSQQLLAKVLRYPASAPMVAKVHKLQALLAQYGPVTAKYEKAAATGNIAAAMAALGAKTMIAKQLAIAYGAATPIVTANLASSGRQIGSTLDGMRTRIIVLTLISVVFGGLVMLLIIRSITSPLTKVTAAAKRFARGAVDVEIDVHGRDEIATVADSFRDAISGQRQIAESLVEFSNRNLAVSFEPRSEEDVVGHAFVELQQQMRSALGDHATTRELQSGMGDLLGTLQHLEQGLQSMNEGDLTV